MKKLAFCFAAAVFALSAPSAHADRTINAGGEKGAYYSLFCPPLPDALKSAAFPGYSCKVTGGTVANIKSVLSDPEQIGIVQLDVFAMQATQNPEEFKKLTVVRPLACEGLWMVTKNPGLKSYADVIRLARRLTFVLPPQDSGSVATFNYLKSIDASGIGRVRKTVYAADTASMLAQVASGEGLDVGFFVQFADPTNANIKAIVENDLTVIPVVSAEIRDAKLGDQSLYEFRQFSLEKDGLISRGAKATTACTPSAVIAQSPAALTDPGDQADQQDLISAIQSVPDDALLPKVGWLAKMMKAATRISDAALKEMVAAAAAVKSATQKALE